MTKISKTHLERDYPELREIASQLGTKIYKHDKAYWIGETQLTYLYENGQKITDERNAEIAKEKLTNAVAEKTAQESLELVARLDAICNKAKKVFQDEGCQHGGFNTVGYDFLDHVTILKNFSMVGWLTVAGRKVAYEGHHGVIDDLIEKLRQTYLEDADKGA